MKIGHKLKAWIGLLLTIFSITFSFSQTTIVKGVVRDSATKKPLQNATVAFKGGRGSVTDAMGRYLLETDRNFTQVVVSYVGFKKATFDVVRGQETEHNFNLIADSTSKLENVVVRKNKHAGYSNRNNPAVDLIKKVIENKSKNRNESYDFAEYEQYEKLEFSLSNPSEKITNKRMLKKYKFILENRDTTKLDGRSLLPVYLQETISKKYLRKDPPDVKTEILADKKVSYGPYFDNNGITAYLNFIYQDIDIYESNINLLTTQFLSPIADLAPTFYMFTIQDTIVSDNGEKLVQLYFTPRNTNDVLFRGVMLITTDGNYAVQKVNLSVSKNININWVRNMRINQEFERNIDGRWHVSKSNLKTEFGLSNNVKAGGVFGERLVSYKDFKIHEARPDSFYKGPAIVEVKESPLQADSFLVANRHDTLSAAETRVYSNMDSLQKMPSFRRLMDIATLLLAGYKTFPGFEVGPVSTFYSFNHLEGFRARVGGRSTTKLSTRYYFQTYVAYGFKDEKWKYYLSAAYSLNNKSIYEFPNSFVRGSYQREVKIPGQELDFVAEDNFLLSFKRGVNNKFLYNDIYRAEFVKEFQNHFSYNLGFKNWKQAPADSLTFTKYPIADQVKIPSITTTELSVELRWAPHEKFYQNRTYRTPLFNKYPIFTFRYIQGIKGFLNGEYTYSNLGLNIFKKFYFSQFGYTHAVLDAGYVFGKVPFPLMTVHRANQTYAYQLQSYNLMNFLEFVSDHHISLNLDHNFNGLIFNRIPLLKKLKWREVATCKLLWGGVRAENNPAINTETLAFPSDVTKDKAGNVTSVVPTTFILDKGPYIEASVGIGNILKVVRVDLVKRFGYLQQPNVQSVGIRVRVKFDF